MELSGELQSSGQGGAELTQGPGAEQALLFVFAQQTALGAVQGDIPVPGKTGIKTCPGNNCPDPKHLAVENPSE